MSSLPERPNRLIVISNRLPISVREHADTKEKEIGPSAGGLVTALSPVLSRLGGVWIGWPGAELDLDALQHQRIQGFNFDLAGVPLSQDQVEKFYLGFSRFISCFSNILVGFISCRILLIF